jgi:Flp pilus assembly protein TadD
VFAAGAQTSRLRERYGRGAVPENTGERIAWFERRLKENPKNLDDLAGLASAYLQKVRETSDFAFLDRASGLVDRMRSEDPENYHALRLRAEIAMHHHRFADVAVYAAELEERNPSDSGIIGLLGDALMELGRHAEAERAYRRMTDLAPGLFSYNRMAFLRFVTGNAPEALGWMSQAVAAGSRNPEHEAWAYTEFGDMLFKTGRASEAERAYRRALTIVPRYHRASGSLGRLRASAGDLAGAAELLRQAQAAVPLPEYADALSHIAALRGDEAEARRQNALVDAVEKLMQANGEKTNRTLALIYASRRRNSQRALELARAEIEARKDVYSYDALAWAEYANGNLDRAREAIGKALALGTPEPIFFYHAGMIALAAGDRDSARGRLTHALELNPAFDFIHAPEARKTLDSLRP